MSLRVYGKKVVVIPISDPDKIGHIIVPDVARERTDQGIIKAVGPECEWCQIGMYVLFNGYSGTALKIEDPERIDNSGRPIAERVLILTEDHIYAEIRDLENLDIPGLYFRGKDDYWIATKDMAVELITQACREERTERPFEAHTVINRERR